SAHRTGQRRRSKTDTDVHVVLAPPPRPVDVFFRLRFFQTLKKTGSLVMTTRLGRLEHKGRASLCALALAASGISGTAHAGMYNDGKVLATGGVITVDGAGGGGITPWATISGYETRDGINGGLHYTFVYLPD